MAQDPEWLVALARDAEIRTGLVLYGNTRDLFWTGLGADYVTLPALLARRLTRYSLRAVWDRVDGLRFETPEQARRWEDAVANAVGGEVEPGTAYDLGPEASDATATVGARI